jgi:hypothetical protein
MRNQHFIIAATIAAISLSYRIAWAQMPPSVKGSRLSASATRQNGVVTFRYAVSAGTNATGAVTFLYVDVSSRCLLTADDAAGITVTSPQGWIGDLTPSSEIGWVSRTNASIQPGQTLSGFSISADKLIGLCPFLLKPSLDTTALGVPAPEFEGDLPSYYAKVEGVVATLSVIGTTIGPVAPPVTFVPAEFLGIIISYKEQAVSLEWIKDRGIGISLDAKLNAALAALNRGDRRAAIGILESVVREVEDRDRDDRNEPQERRQLSPEAVALLKVNTNYLINQIENPRPPSRGDGEREKHDGSGK